MNLFFRFWWMVLCTRFARARTGIFDEGRLTFRCMPHDIDINWHMTNSRYFSFMDIGRIDFFLRCGLRRIARKAGIRSMVGSTAVKFMRGVDPWQKFSVATRVLTWDDRWLYSLQKIYVGDVVATTAFFKMAYLGPQGQRLAPAELLKQIGHTDPPPPMAEALKTLNALDRELAARAQD